MGMIEKGVYTPQVMALSIGKTRENDDIFPMIYRKTCVLSPFYFIIPKMSLHNNWWMFWWDTLMGSNGHLVGFFMFFSHRTLISWRSPFQKVACSIRTSWIFLRHGLVPWVNMGYGIVIQNSEHDWTPKVSYTGYRKNTYLMDWWPPKNHAIMASWHISNLIVAFLLQNGG